MFVYVIEYTAYVCYVYCAINLRKIMYYFPFKILFLHILFYDFTKKAEINITELIFDFGIFYRSNLV